MTLDFSSWYRRVFPQLSGYGLWLRGGEINSLPVEECARRPFRVLFARMSTYRDTAASFTHRLLYHVAAGVEGVFPDLSYLPPPGDAAILDQEGVPWLLGVGAKLGPRGFDLIGLSNSVVQELVNLPTMLRKSGVPLRKSARMEDAGLPLVILGGANALGAATLLTDDPLVDGVFAGDDTAAIARLLEVCRDGKARGSPKRVVLDELDAVPGFFQPEKIRAGGHVTIRPGATPPAPVYGPVAYAEETAGTGNLPISAGCRCWCGFCFESWTHKPYQETDAPHLMAQALLLKARLGLDEVELFSFNFNMHRDIYRLLWDLVDIFPHIGLKSQRLDMLARDPNLLAYLHALGKTSLTFGIEGISARLRRYLHKGLDEDDIRTGLRRVVQGPVREVKLFLIATGLEADADYEELEALADELRAAMRGSNRKPKVTFSMTPLVRFPHTPLEFADAAAPEAYAPVFKKVNSIVRTRGFEFRASASLEDYLVSQVLVRPPGPQACTALELAAEETGFVYYEEVTEAFARAFERRLEEVGLTRDMLLRGTRAGAPRSVPWAGTQTNVSRTFLRARYDLAVGERQAEECRGGAEGAGSCLACGACRTRRHRQAVTARRGHAVIGSQRLREKLASIRAGVREQSVLVDVGEKAAGVPRRLLGVALARAFMLAEPGLTPHYWGYRRSHWARGSAAPWVTGADVVTQAWRGPGTAMLRDILSTEAGLAKINLLMDGWGAVRGVADEQEFAPRLEARAPFAFRESGYLAAKRLKFTRKKLGEKEYVFEFGADSLKKKVLRSLRVTDLGSEGCGLVLVPDVNFDAEEFARLAFTLPGERDWVRVGLRAVAGD